MESNNKIFTETIGTSSIAKTMRNSLVPTESTKRNIEKNGIIIDDQLRAEKRQQLKEIMDEYYRTYIDNKLSNVALTRTIDWKELFQAIEDNYKQNTTKTKNELEKKQKEKRAEIYKILSDDEEFKQLFNAKLLTNILPEFIKNQNIDNEEKVREFSEKALLADNGYNKDLLKIEDRWILNKLDKLVSEVSKNIDNYDIGIAVDKIYNFIWNEFCDWYIEMVKPRMYSEDEKIKVQVSAMLNYVFGNSLKLLHPFMPFITSEIYSKLICFGTEDLIVSKWPEIKHKFAFDADESIVESLKKLITEIRNVRTKMNVHPSKKSKLILVTNLDKKELKESEEFLLKLGFASEIILQEKEENIPQNAVSIVVDEIKAYIPFEELVDIEQEKARLQEEIKRLEAEVARGNKMLSNPGFVNKAPEAKVQEEKDKLANYEQMLKATKERLESLK